MDYQEYTSDIKERVATTMEDEGISEPSAFFRTMLNVMSEYGICDDVSVLEMQDDIKVGSKLIHIDGYSFDETDHSLSMFIYDYDPSDSPARLTSAMVDRLYWRLFYFLETACSEGVAKYMGNGTIPFKAANQIRDKMNRALSDPERVLKIHFIVITNRELDTKLLGQNLFEQGKRAGKKSPKSRKRVKREEFAGRQVDFDLWPLDRFFSVESAGNNELIEMDFLSEFGSEGFPCLKGNIGASLNYDAYIGIIPGKLLADIYIEYGSRVLEGNVRAFLGTKSAKGVNNGIKKTINTEPSNFFTYNNGIAVTATAITTAERDGQLFVTGATDLQIINGGQTTATLAEAVLKKTNPDLAGIYVPIKLTVIADREQETDEGILVYDQMVHDIARFANSQNKVTAADLFSNDPFHIWMEKSSKKYLAPPVHFNIPTGWYYERARKKYEQEQLKLSGDELKRFLAKYPKKQIITKEKLALYLTAVAEKPHLCSKGKNWVMKEYGTEIGEIYKKDKAIFNEYYFKKCICAAIIYITVDDYLESNKRDPNFWYSAGGFKGNIVPYTVAKIISALPNGYTLNWTNIWTMQGVSPAFMKEIEKVTYLANQFFLSCTGVLISEFCKRETTWVEFRDHVHYEISREFEGELIPVSLERDLSRSAVKEQKDTDELRVVMEVMNKGVTYWQGIIKTANEGNLLSKSELNNLLELIPFIKKGNIPCTSSGKVPNKTMTMIKNALSAESKLSEEGVVSFFDADDDVVYELNLTDYRMH